MLNGITLAAILPERKRRSFSSGFRDSEKQEFPFRNKKRFTTPRSLTHCIRTRQIMISSVLHNTNDSFVICIEQPSTNGETSTYLTIDKTRLTVQISPSLPPSSLSSSSSSLSSSPKTIYGILGSIQLAHNHYLAVITDIVMIGTLFDHHQIFKIASVEWIPFQSSSSSSSAVGDSDDDSDDVRYLQLLNSLVASQNFYFSDTYDMTRSVQNWYAAPVYGTADVDQERVDRNFMWNHFLASQFMSHVSIVDNHHNNNMTTTCKSALSQIVLPVIRGFVEIRHCTLGSSSSSSTNNGRDHHHHFKLCIVSRLGVKRVGTRYNIRGLDHEGNVANYAETEQIVETSNQVLSFLQLRGSIPLYWTQKTTLKYSPKIKLSSKLDSSQGFKLHFEQQLARYKDVVIVNLVKLKGSEKLLADAYEMEAKKYGNDRLRYIAFDFHNRCQSLNFSAVSELVQEIEDGIHDHAYFVYDKESRSVAKQQTGIVRVNCIDCLDRTNVVESVFARHVLTKQLRSLELIHDGDEVANHPHLESIFKNAWADNGDGLSSMYAGTGALKADFTRTGKRSIMGLYNDGMNSLTRYYLNNFTDGAKQDAINLFLGKYSVNPTSPSPFTGARPPVFTVLNYALFAALFVIALRKTQQ